MAWGSQGMVFLGEDLMHSRDYSDETARVIDEEVERILREEEDRAREVLKRHRLGLDAVARALLEKETIDGAEVGHHVDQAAGYVVRRRQEPPRILEGDGDGAGDAPAEAPVGGGRASYGASETGAERPTDVGRDRPPR